MSLVKIAVTFDPTNVKYWYKERNLPPALKEEVVKALKWRNRARSVFSKNPGLKEQALDKIKRLKSEVSNYERHLQPETKERLSNLEKVLNMKGGKGHFGL